MKPCSRVILAGSLAVCSSAAHAEDSVEMFGANVSLTTDYTFRGISQTDENPAIQGGFDFNHPTGLLAGIWASNVDFNDGDEASIEIDYYAGFSKSLANGLGLELMAIYYSYPGADPDSFDYDYGELTVGGSYKWFNAKLWYSPDFFAESGDAIYVEGNLDVPLPAEFGLGLHVGYQTIDDNGRFGTPDYTDWQVSISKELVGLGLALSYVDTDLSDDECFGGTELCDARVVFSVSKSL